MKKNYIDAISSRIIDNINTILVKQCKTKTELSVLTDINRSNLVNKLNKKSGGISRDYIERIATALNVPMSVLVDVEDSIPTLNSFLSELSAMNLTVDDMKKVLTFAKSLHHTNPK